MPPAALVNNSGHRDRRLDPTPRGGLRLAPRAPDGGRQLQHAPVPVFHPAPDDRRHRGAPRLEQLRRAQKPPRTDVPVRRSTTKSPTPTARFRAANNWKSRSNSPCRPSKVTGCSAAASPRSARSRATRSARSRAARACQHPAGRSDRPLEVQAHRLRARLQPTGSHYSPIRIAIEYAAGWKLFGDHFQIDSVNLDFELRTERETPCAPGEALRADADRRRAALRHRRPVPRQGGVRAARSRQQADRRQGLRILRRRSAERLPGSGDLSARLRVLHRTRRA